MKSKSSTPAITPKPNEQLRAAMVLAGYTQDTMSRAIGISYSAFNLKINGEREFLLSECKRIANKLNKSLDTLFFTDNVPK